MELSPASNLVVTRFNHNFDAVRTHQEKLRLGYDLYRGVYQKKFHPFRNNINIPLLFSMVQSSVARKMSMLFGTKPWVAVVGGGPEDTAKARKQETLLQIQLEDANTFEKGVEFLTSADLYGVSVARAFWDYRIGAAEIRADIPGRGEVRFNAPVTKFNGPNWENIDLLDFFPPAGFSKLSDMPYVIYRYWMDLGDVQEAGDVGYFDKPAVRMLQVSPGPPSTVMTDMQARRSMGWGNPEMAFKFDEFSKPVEIIELWGLVPRGICKGPELNRVVSIGNRQVVLRDRPNPMPNETLPFFAHSPMPDPHYFFSAGMVEINMKLQVASNRIANQKADALDLTIDPFILYNRRSGFDPRQLRIRPLGAIGMDGNPSEMVMPFAPDLRGLQTSYTELEQQSRWMQQGAGITEDTVQGFSAGDRVTKAEFVGRQEAVSNRILHAVRLAESQWLEPMTRLFLAMDRKWLPADQTLRMIGAAAVLDPVTLQPIEQEPLEVGINDLLPDYDIRIVGSTRQLGTQARQQNLMMAMQAIQANPMAAAIINWMALYRLFFQTLEIPGVDQLFMTDALMKQAVMQAGMVLQQAGALGQEGEGGGEEEGGQEGQGTMLGLDPAALGKMMNMNGADLGPGGTGKSKPE